MTKNVDFDKYKYSGYGIGFDRHGNSSFLDIGLGRNVITFGVDISAFVHIGNKKKDILILGKGPTQGLEHSLTAEKMYLINFAKHNKMFCMSLHYNRANSYIFVTSQEIHKSKAKDSEIVATPLCLGSISSISVDNMKETGLNGYVYDFSVDYSDTAVDDMLDIHNYLMKKDNISIISIKKNKYNKMFGFVKQIFISTMMFFGSNLPSVNSLKCISMNNQ